jgi:hypothetical protein
MPSGIYFPPANLKFHTLPGSDSLRIPLLLHCYRYHFAFEHFLLSKIF